MGKRKSGGRRPDAQEAPRKRTAPTWLRRAVCIAGSVFLMFCAVYMLVARAIGGNGVLVGIVGAVVFAVMAVHLFRAGLGDGTWRVDR